MKPVRLLIFFILFANCTLAQVKCVDATVQQQVSGVKDGPKETIYRISMFSTASAQQLTYSELCVNGKCYPVTSLRDTKGKLISYYPRNDTVVVIFSILENMNSPKDADELKNGSASSNEVYLIYLKKKKKHKYKVRCLRKLETVYLQ